MIELGSKKPQSKFFLRASFKIKAHLMVLTETNSTEMGNLKPLCVFKHWKDGLPEYMLN